MDKVFGREEILSAIKKRLDGFKKGYRQNIAFIGNPSTGKTSILRALLSDINTAEVMPIFMELEGRSLKQVIRVFSGQILRNFLTYQRIDISGDFKYLLEKSQAFLPKTVAKIKSIVHNLEKEKEYAALIETFDLPQVFFEENGIPCLLILDEFQKLQDLGGEEIFADLSKKIIIQKNTMYLIASSAAIKAREILSHGFSLLFGNFEVLEVAPYNMRTAEKFININLKIPISDTYKKFLIYFTGGQPFYLGILCRELSMRAAQICKDSISEDILTGTFQDLLFEKWGIFNQKFMNLLNEISSDKQREDYIGILSSIISGGNKIKIIAQRLNKKEKIIQQRLLRLYEASIVLKNGDFLSLGDKIFAFWLDSVYSRKFAFDYFNDNVLRIDFRNNLLNMVNNFSLVTAKTTTERILELFNLFRSEAIQIERKKIILSRFKEIALLPGENGNFDALISAKAQDSSWIIAVKNGALSENDIAEFMLGCKKYKTIVPQRKVIISLDKVDTNAKLKALEEKIITWGTGELNSLFEFYNQPEIFV